MTQNQEKADEDWVKAAMTDASAVAELLLRLRHSPPAKTNSLFPTTLPLEWSARQRRSKPMMKDVQNKPTPRASPTTPLSWSGATTSVSGGAGDGFEESSRPQPKRPDGARSKVFAASGITANKKSRKKKPLAELKEEETLLLKERRHLKRQLATLRATLEKRTAMNESLKKYKLEMVSQPALDEVAGFTSVEVIPDQMQQQVACHDPISSILPPGVKREDNDDLKRIPTLEISSNKFVLPDLNIPLDEHSYIERSCKE